MNRMKRIIILIIGYISLGIIISIMQSCLGYDVWITDIVFKSSYYYSKDTDVDDMTKNIEFMIVAGHSPSPYWRDREKAQIIKNINIFSKCYAIKVCATWKNDLDVSSFSMTFDRDFVYDSDTIKSGIDIFRIESIKKDILINKEKESCYDICYRMNFSSKLTNKLTFESGEYIVYFSCKTTDGKEFNKSRRVIFK